MSPIQNKLLIGPSTGWLYAIDIYSLLKQEEIFKKAGATAVEICLGGLDIRDKRMVSLKGNEIFGDNFLYRSLHLPDFGDITELVNQERVSLVKSLISRHQITTVLTHPLKIKGDYPTGRYIKMVAGGVPLAIENMDLRKDSGFKIAELKILVDDIGLGFILDVQHAFEHDPGMQYAEELFEALADQLVHLHVSGETKDNIHSLVCKARNAKKILEFISKILSRKNVPLILEGEYTDSLGLSEEIGFLTKELGFH